MLNFKSWWRGKALILMYFIDGYIASNLNQSLTY